MGDKNMAKNETAKKAIALTGKDRGFQFTVNLFLGLMFIIIFIPLWSTIMLSVRPSTYIGSHVEGMFLPVWEWSLSAYKALLGNRGFLQSFLNSLKIMFFGVISALLLTVPLAYGLSVKELPGRRGITFYILLPYIFNVGLVPTYILVSRLGLINNLASVFLPGAIGAYNCLIMRNFFEELPNEIKESAKIDGCNEIQVLVRIIIPLSKAILLTIGLYYAVSFWNDFFHPMLYLNVDSLRPLPILLRNILLASGMNEFVEAKAFGEASVEAIKAASVFMSAIPMMIAYPFIQKYFTKGTLVGSVKG